MRLPSAVVLCAVGCLGRMATAQVEVCGIDGAENLIEWGHSIQIIGTQTSGPAPSAGYGSAASLLAGLSMYTSSGPMCGSNNPLLPESGPGPQAAADYDSGALPSTVSTSVSGFAENYDGLTEVFAMSDVFSDGISGSTYFFRQAVASQLFWNKYDLVTMSPTCTRWGRIETVTSGLASAYGTAEYEYPDGGSQVVVDWVITHNNVESSLDRSEYNQSGCTGQTITSSVTRSAAFSNVVITGLANGTPVTPVVSQFLMARRENGTWARMGTALDSALDPSTSGDEYTIDGTTDDEIQITLPAGESRSISVSIESIVINVPIGDLDHDGGVDRCELISWMSLYGTDFGDVGYNIECDVNLDGTIDADDTGLAWSMLCRKDFNCDGGADSSDVSDLADAIASGGIPLTDVNLDASGDNSDIIDLADAIAGNYCP